MHRAEIISQELKLLPQFFLKNPLRRAHLLVTDHFSTDRHRQKDKKTKRQKDKKSEKSESWKVRKSKCQKVSKSESQKVSELESTKDSGEYLQL